MHGQQNIKKKVKTFFVEGIPLCCRIEKNNNKFVCTVKHNNISFNLLANKRNKILLCLIVQINLLLAFNSIT